MRKGICAVMAALLLALLGSMTVLCVHCSMLPQTVTQYYEEKAEREAESQDSAEAELMRLLLGGTGTAEKREKQVFSPGFSRYGLLLALSALAAELFFFARNEKRTGHFIVALLAAVFGLAGARLVYCAVNFGFYVLDVGAPLAMLRIWEGGLSLSGALAGAVLGAWLGAKAGKEDFAQVLDHLLPSLLLFAAGARLSEMAVAAGFGMEMVFPLSIFTQKIGDGYRLNTALLMAAADLLLFGASLTKARHRAGDRFLLGMLIYGTAHILLESMRRDGHMLLGFVHMEQLFALLIALPVLLILSHRAQRTLLSLLSTLVLAGAVIALEFALDRSSVSDVLLYAVFACFIGGYLALCVYIFRRQDQLYRWGGIFRA